MNAFLLVAYSLFPRSSLKIAERGGYIKLLTVKLIPTTLISPPFQGHHGKGQTLVSPGNAINVLINVRNPESIMSIPGYCLVSSLTTSPSNTHSLPLLLQFKAPA